MFNDLMVLFLILWLLLPLGLIPVVIVLIVENVSLGRQLREKRFDSVPGSQKEPISTFQSIQMPPHPSVQSSEQLSRQSTPHPSVQSSEQLSRQSTLQPWVQSSSSQTVVLPHLQNPSPQWIPTGSQTAARERKSEPRERKSEPRERKKEGGLEQAALIAGVLFILIASLIFVTTTWQVMPGWIKALSLLAVGGVFFLASVLAGRLLKLLHTSIAFYVLGCFSIPAVLMAVSFFHLWGFWFAVDGEGKFFFWLAMFGSFALLMAIGWQFFRHGIFALVGWICSMPVVYSVGRILFYYEDSGMFLLACYGAGLYTWKWRQKGWKLLLALQPLSVWFAVNRGFAVLFRKKFLETVSEGRWRNVPETVVVLFLFFLYWSGKAVIKGKSLKSTVSDLLFPLLLIGYGFYGIGKGDYGAACLAIDGSAACLALQSWMEEDHRSSLIKVSETNVFRNGSGKRKACGAAAVLLVWFYFLPMFLWVDQAGFSWGSESFLVYFTVLTCAGMVCGVKRRLFAFVKPMEISAVFTWAAAAAAGSLWCAVEYGGQHSWKAMMWVGFFWLAAAGLWTLQDKKTYHLAFEILLWLLPPLTGLAAGNWMDWPVMISVWLVWAASSVACSLIGLRTRRKSCRYMGLIGCCVGTAMAGLEFICDFTLARVWAGGFFLCLGASIYIGKKEKKSIWTGIPLSVVFSVLWAMLEEGHWKGDRNVFLGVSLAVGTLMEVAGRLLYPQIVDFGKKENGTERKWELDFLSLIGLTAPILMITEKNPCWKFWGIIVLALYLINGVVSPPHCVRRKGARLGATGEKTVLTLVLALVPAAWAKVPYWEIPRQWEMESVLTAMLIAGFCLRYIWKGKERNEAEWAYFSLAVLAVLIQGIDCLFGKNILDVIALGTAMAGTMILSYQIRRKRWLHLSFITLLCLALYLSKDFWLSIQWWVYLMAVGFLLIGTAAGYEYRRREGRNKDKRKEDPGEGTEK